MDLVKTKDGLESDKKIFGPGPGPEKNKKIRPGPEPGPEKKKIIQTRVRVWACPQPPNEL